MPVAIGRRFTSLVRLLPALAPAGLAGCNTLPVITPDMARADSQSMQFKTASGRILSLLHAKTAVIDGVGVTVCSTNLDWRSFLHNQVLTAVILGAEFGVKMHEAFERDLAVSNHITLEAWRSRGAGTRAKEWFGRLWEYWL